jgi:hypothetical protein
VTFKHVNVHKDKKLFPFLIETTFSVQMLSGETTAAVSHNHPGHKLQSVAKLRFLILQQAVYQINTRNSTFNIHYEAYHCKTLRHILPSPRIQKYLSKLFAAPYVLDSALCPKAVKKVKQSRYRPGVAQRVAGS